MATRKDVAKSIKTLLVMLQSLKDQQVTITLRNDTTVRGTIIKVDSDMSIELRDATVESDPFYCTNSTATTTITPSAPTSTQPTSSVGESFQRPDSDSEVDMGDLDNAPAITNDDNQNICQTGGDGEQCDGDKQTAASRDYFVIKGSRIRHIDLPADYDLVAGTRREIERIRSKRKQWTKRDIVRSSTNTNTT